VGKGGEALCTLQIDPTSTGRKRKPTAGVCLANKQGKKKKKHRDEPAYSTPYSQKKGTNANRNAREVQSQNGQKISQKRPKEPDSIH